MFNKASQFPTCVAWRRVMKVATFYGIIRLTMRQVPISISRTTIDNVSFSNTPRYHGYRREGCGV